MQKITYKKFGQKKLLVQQVIDVVKLTSFLLLAIGLYLTLQILESWI